MAKANQLLKTIGEKLGLSAEEITKLSGNDSFGSIEIDEALANKISSTEIFTEESAASNSKIRAKLRAEVLDGIDADQKRIALERGLTEEDVTELFKIDKTSARQKALIEKISNLEREKAVATGKAKTELEKEIEKLNGQVKTVREEYEGKLKSLSMERENDRTEWEKSSLYDSLDWHTPEGFDEDVIITGGKAKLEKQLREKGIILKRTESGLAPFNQKEDTPYFENNIKFSAKDLITKMATENKLLKVSGGQQKQNQQTQFHPQSGNGNVGGGDKLSVNLTELNSRLDESLKREFGQ